MSGHDPSSSDPERLPRIVVRAFAVGLASAVAALGGAALRPRVTLREDSVLLTLPPEAVVAHLYERFTDDPSVIAGDPNCVVRRFSGRAGPFPYRTVEVMGFGPRAITFEHLRGPFASCRERFDLDPVPTGTRLTHRGDYRLRGGLWTWPLAAGPVRRAFERHVHAHLAVLGAELLSADTLGEEPSPVD